MWVHFIDYMFEKGGFLGIVCVVEAFVIYFLFRKYTDKTDKLDTELAGHRDKCIDCVKEHATTISELNGMHQEHLDKMQGRCCEMITSFYDTNRKDMENSRQENLDLFKRVVDSNDDVTNGLNAVNNTLSGIAGKLNGR